MGNLNKTQFVNEFVSADNETLELIIALLKLDNEKQKEVLKGIETENPAELKSILKNKIINLNKAEPNGRTGTDEEPKRFLYLELPKRSADQEQRKGEKMRIGEKIKKYMELNNINKKEIAEKSGLSEKHFNNILNNAEINCIDYYNIVKALNVSLDMFLI